MTQINYDAKNAIEIVSGVFHLGVEDKRNSFANIPYLLVDGDEGVLIDPGSARPEFFSVVLKKVHQVIDPRKIKHMIVQHQDPDLCAALPIFEKIAAPDVKIWAPLEAQVLVQHYGCTRDISPLDDGDTLIFGNNRTLIFAAIPYCHFIGTTVTYDVKTKTLFSSDAFGGFTGKSVLYADSDYPVQLTTFLGQYLGSKKALVYALKRVEALAASHGIDRICPQHGCVIDKEQIPTYIKAAYDLHVGGEVDGLAAKHKIDMSQFKE